MTSSGYVLFVFTYYYADRINSIGHDYFYVYGIGKTNEEVKQEASKRTKQIAKEKNIIITDFRISDDDAQLFKKVK